MKFSIYRKSNFSKEETINNIKSAAEKHNINIIGEINLPESRGVLFQACNQGIVDKVIKMDKNLLGLIPCNLVVIEEDGDVFVGSGNPALLSGVTKEREIQKVAMESESLIRDILSEISGTEEPKVEHIKLYSTMTCPYCNQEKEWLESNKVKHEVVYVDLNQKEAENMVRNTGQMGVPVTEIGYDDGEVEYVVGFDKEKLSKVIEL